MLERFRRANGRLNKPITHRGQDSAVGAVTSSGRPSAGARMALAFFRGAVHEAASWRLLSSLSGGPSAAESRPLRGNGNQYQVRRALQHRVALQRPGEISCFSGVDGR